MEVLAKEVEVRKQLQLKGTNLTQTHKDRTWAAVAEKVNFFLE